MKKLFVLICALMFVFCGTAFADEMTGSGNFNINASVIGGGIDGNLRFTFVPGITGGVAAAGGVAAGEGSGFIQTFKFGRYTIPLGTSEGEVGVTAGGLVNTHPIFGGTSSEAIGSAGIWGSVKVFGLAGAEVGAFSIAGEGTADFSTGFNRTGFTSGFAGQYAVGGLVGGAGALGIGSGDFEGQINMYGNSFSSSWTKCEFDGTSLTRSLGTNVGASTQVNSFQSVKDSGIGFAFIEGGYTAAGLAKTCTFQLAPNGFAKASAVGIYQGSGPLGTNFYGSANGYSATSVSTIPGWKGSINSASSGMQVRVGTTGPQVQ
jgi:hypothetical protein